MKFLRTTLCVALLSISLLSAHQVMTWVSPYAKEENKTLIQNSEQSNWMASGLTRLGLQFWVPTYSGGVDYATHEPETVPTDEDVTLYRDWAHQNNIAVLLCIYNAMNGWDWGLAFSAFKANGGETLASALVAEMERLQLDGIDLDLEGLGNQESDRAAYKIFVQKLSAKLKAKKKLLTIDTFHSPCYNAPNVSWWGDWVGLVDNIHTMGYEDLYEGNPTALCGIENIFKYSRQNQFGDDADLPNGTILMGLPTLPNWGSGGKGSSLVSHLEEVKEVGNGIAIWEMRGMAISPWNEKNTWDRIAEIKGESCGFHPEDPRCTGEDPNTIQPQAVSASGVVRLKALSRNGIELQLQGESGDGRAELYNVGGQRIASTPIASGESVVLGQQLQHGLYFVRIQTSTLQWNQSVVIR